MVRSLLRFSVSSSIVVHVVREADSKDPGVTCGLSPTVKEADFFAFFSKYLLDNALSYKPSVLGEIPQFLRIFTLDD